uniref:Uncharacterized protein n=1 Tax=Arundo donax TaxID=35708 RepID=A0A0A9FPE4_ARUDO
MLVMVTLRRMLEWSRRSGRRRITMQSLE